MGTIGRWWLVSWKCLRSKPVAIDLVDARAIELLCAEFVFNDKDNPVLKDDQIGPSAHSWYEELHEELCRSQLRSQHPQMANLIFPRRPLGWFNGKREFEGKPAEKFGIACGADLLSRNRNIGPIHMTCLPEYVGKLQQISVTIRCRMFLLPASDQYIELSLNDFIILTGCLLIARTVSSYVPARR